MPNQNEQMERTIRSIIEQMMDVMADMQEPPGEDLKIFDYCLQKLGELLCEICGCEVKLNRNKENVVTSFTLSTTYRNNYCEEDEE